MSFLPAERLPDDPDALARRQEARAVLDSFHHLLALPAFAQDVGVHMLTKIAAGQGYSEREQRRAAETLARLKFDLQRLLADLLCLKEQRLDDLGIQAPGPAAQAIAVATAVTKIEIVREKDWRDAATSDDRA